MAIYSVILAAGKGTRMRSHLPKVLHKLQGIPMLHRVLDSARKISTPIVVYGHGGDLVRASTPDSDIIWVEQAAQLGTGHALKMALPHLPQDGKTLILSGDVPLIQANTLKALSQHDFAVLTVAVDNPTGFGRIIHQDGKICAIVEEKDANDDERAIDIINTGIYCIHNALLHKYLPKLNNDNAAQEYYLTDIFKMAHQDGVAIQDVRTHNIFEVQGVNDPIQLHDLAKNYLAHSIVDFQKHGVYFADSAQVQLRGHNQIGTDTHIDIGVVLQNCQIGQGVSIGAGCVLTDTHIADGATILPYTVAQGAQIGAGAQIGPFAHLRGNSVISENAKVGNFCETKNTVLGAHSKVNHLSYLGDTNVGAGVNIGAGTITCNYDGAYKHPTTISDNAFIGSNTLLIAPVVVGKNATIGAGTVLTQDAPADKLTLARASLSTHNYTRPKK